MVAVIAMVIGIVLMIPTYNITKEPISGIFLAFAEVTALTAVGAMLDGYLHEEKKHH
jgi:hypothetical protein